MIPHCKILNHPSWRVTQIQHEDMVCLGWLAYAPDELQSEWLEHYFMKLLRFKAPMGLRKEFIQTGAKFTPGAPRTPGVMAWHLWTNPDGAGMSVKIYQALGAKARSALPWGCQIKLVPSPKTLKDTRTNVPPLYHGNYMIKMRDHHLKRKTDVLTIIVSNIIQDPTRLVEVPDPEDSSPAPAMKKISFIDALYSIGIKRTEKDKVASKQLRDEFKRRRALGIQGIAETGEDVPASSDQHQHVNLDAEEDPSDDEADGDQDDEADGDQDDELLTPTNEPEPTPPPAPLPPGTKDEAFWQNLDAIQRKDLIVKHVVNRPLFAAIYPHYTPGSYILCSSAKVESQAKNIAGGLVAFFSHFYGPDPTKKWFSHWAITQSRKEKSRWNSNTGRIESTLMDSGDQFLSWMDEVSDMEEDSLDQSDTTPQDNLIVMDHTLTGQLDCGDTVTSMVAQPYASTNPPNEISIASVDGSSSLTGDSTRFILPAGLTREQMAMLRNALNQKLDNPGGASPMSDE